MDCLGNILPFVICSCLTVKLLNEIDCCVLYVLKDGLRTWAKQIVAALCLINGKPVTDDSELLSGQVSCFPFFFFFFNLRLFWIIVDCFYPSQ